ncbi:glycoside hydrolase family 97 protein [candidate division KSB1 bacterium]|nr:glycoside hydrolase family 97 protein [candidate division KSB1 bacterium]
MKTKIFCSLAILLTGVTFAVQLQSPDGRILVSVDIKEKLEPYAAGSRLYYSVQFDGKAVLLDSPFRLDFKDAPPLAKNLKILETQTSTIKETWNPVWGTHSSIENFCHQTEMTVQEQEKPQRKIQFIVRAYNDGVAFRYGFPAESGIKDFKLTQEYSEFFFPGNPTVWAADYGSYRTHQETEYEKKLLNELQPGDIIGCPLLLQLPSAWVALTEANLTDWAGLYFTRSMASSNAVVSLLSPRLDEPDVAVIGTAPRLSPWRTIMIADTPGALIESNIVPNLADPCEIEDTSWIRPGKCAWDRWWCGSYAPDFPGSLGVDNPSMKYFIDFAAEMGWQYQLVDWYWYGPPFDPAQPLGSAGNPAVSILKQAENIDIPELVRYAAKKGVKILVWLDWFNADREMEKAFPLYEKWGVAGVKVDFMARDDQYVVNFYHRLVKLAAKHHLTVDFHGAYKPTGFSRTYPNLLTREGVMGNEYNKWSDSITPTHNVTLPFTRMLCGPMDYTPGGFRNKTVETFRVVGGDAPGPFVQTTRAQQLAMMVVYDSPLQVLCDSPYNYRISPAGLDFLRAVPTTWENTRVLSGFPGEYIVMARRSGEEWYLGAMTNENLRTVEIPLNFLGKGKYKALIYADPDEAGDYPDRLLAVTRTVTPADVLTAEMAGGGGYVVRIVPE